MRCTREPLALCLVTLMLSTQPHADEPIRLAVDGRALATVVPGDAPEVDWRYIAGIVRDRLQDRCDVRLPVADSATGTRIALGVDAELERGAYVLRSGKSGVSIRGGSLVSLLHGAGRWLRSVEAAPGRATALPGDLQAKPYAKLTCMYTPPHFHNSYEKGPIADVQEAYEEMALWGANAVCVWADPFEVGDPFAATVVDDEGRAFWGRCASLLRVAQRLGLGTGLVITPNVAHRQNQFNQRLQLQTPVALAPGDLQRPLAGIYGPLDVATIDPQDPGQVTEELSRLERIGRYQLQRALHRWGHPSGQR